MAAGGAVAGESALDQALAAAAHGDEQHAVAVEAGEVGVGGEAAVEGEVARGGAVAAEEVEELLDGVVGGLGADAAGGLALEGLGVVRGEQNVRRSVVGRRHDSGPLGAGASRQAWEAFLLEHFVGRPLAGGARFVGVEAGFDVGDGEVVIAQCDHALAHGICRGDRGASARHGRAEEEVGGSVEAAEVAGHVVHGAEGIAEALGDLPRGQALVEEGAYSDERYRCSCGKVWAFDGGGPDTARISSPSIWSCFAASGIGPDSWSGLTTFRTAPKLVHLPQRTRLVDPLSGDPAEAGPRLPFG